MIYEVGTESLVYSHTFLIVSQYRLSIACLMNNNWSHILKQRTSNSLIQSLS